VTTEHLPLERLSALIDHEVDAAEVAEANHHLAVCPACRSELARLRALLEHAGALPLSVEPPPEAWTALRHRLRARTARGEWRVGPARHGWSWGLRAAAAIVLVAASSAITAIALRSPVRQAAERLTRTRSTTPLLLPASARAMERSYGDAVDELTATLEAQRGALTPETVATLERSLRVIDEAIAEARGALASDPANATLLDVLSANYQQKVELLRRVSELPART
jgi:anti-sigma factor RsiW